MKSLSVIARYPFLKDAKQLVKKENISVTELIKDPLYERARSIAIERLDNAFEHKDVGIRRLINDSDCIMELYSYPLARMISCCIADSYFTRRYALGEAVRFFKNLNKESISFLIQIIKEFEFNIQFNEETEDISIHFTDYINFAPTRYKKWKLVNREMKEGYVTIDSKDLSRLAQEALRHRINEELIDKPCHELIKNTFLEDVTRIKNKVATQRKKNEIIPMGKLDVKKLPPCIKMLLADVQAGENVAHMGRFALVSFLNSLKLTTQNIIDLFNTAPDFDEEKSQYQIDHITGRVNATTYKPPACDKMKTYGLCPSEHVDEICKRTNHPLSYYKYKWQMEQHKNKKNQKKD